MKKLLSIALVLSVAVLPACKKTDNTDSHPTVNSVDDIKVPEGFLWASSRDVNITVNITDGRFGSAQHSVAIYDGDPYNGGSLLAKGSASTSKAYGNTLHLSKQITEVYVVKTSPDNSRIINTLDVSGASATLSFGDIDRNLVEKPNLNGYAKTTAIDCNSGCTNTITSNTNNVYVGSNDVVCITGNNITVSFSQVNGIVRVCGSNVTLSNISLNSSSAALHVSSTGSVNLSSLNINSSYADIENEGTINISSTSAIKGFFKNSGTYNVSGDFNINSDAQSVLNDGIINISGNFNVGSADDDVINNGTINVSGSFQRNSGSHDFINNCALIIGGNYTQNDEVKNYKYIQVSGTTTINSGSNTTQLRLYNGAMFYSTGNFTANARVKGYGSTSLVKIDGSVTLNSNSDFNDNLQVCTNATISSNKLTSGATTGCSLYIAQDGCNTTGNGGPTVIDTDNDGAPDNTDDYPNDPTKAYNNYYPSSTGMVTAAFEDQWPAKGDYDFNDVVMSYRYQIVTNATDNVVEVNGTYKLHATGGSYLNAFAVQFPIDRATVSGLTGGDLEDNQSKAVVRLFNNMREEMSNWNTVSGDPVSAAKDYSISFNVANGPAISTFGLSGYNPFIWNAGDGRGREIHLPGQLPTDLANTSMFGTEDDNSSVSGNRYYLTNTGLPYAIEVPANPFNYPYEMVDITQAYLHFADWAQSGGASFADWYSNTGAGYRNNSNIYNQ